MGSLIKNILFALVIAALLFVGYKVFLAEDEAALTTDSVQVTTQATIDTQEFLIRLQQLRDIELSDEIFSDARFQSFTDHRREIEDEPAGRANPFAPIGQ